MGAGTSGHDGAIAWLAAGVVSARRVATLVSSGCAGGDVGAAVGMTLCCAPADTSDDASWRRRGSVDLNASAARGVRRTDGSARSSKSSGDASGSCPARGDAGSDLPGRLRGDAAGVAPIAPMVPPIPDPDERALGGCVPQALSAWPTVTELEASDPTAPTPLTPPRLSGALGRSCEGGAGEFGAENSAADAAFPYSLRLLLKLTDLSCRIPIRSRVRTSSTGSCSSTPAVATDCEPTPSDG